MNAGQPTHHHRGNEEAIQACVDKEKNDTLGKCYAGSESVMR